MKKRSPPPGADSSASSSSSSSSSCVVDYDDHNDNHNDTHNQEIDEQDKPPKPKRARRKRVSINPKAKPAEKCPNNNNNNANANANNPTNRRSSIYRGVTRHRWTGRFEAHLWDKSSWNSIQNKKGRQVYLGAYDSEVDAARTYDLAALKYWGPETTLNFPIENYTKEVDEMQNVSKEEYLASLRRRSSGFSRGVSKYRGVARHHHNGRWEARIGRVFGNKYLYLGTFSSQEEAAAAYDLAAIEYRGANAVTNFDISNYIGRVKNLMPKGQPEPPNPNQTNPVNQQQEQDQEQEQEQQKPKIKQQQVEEQQDEVEVQDHKNLKEREQQEQTTPSKLEESNLVGTIDHSSMLVMSPDDESENPWSFCMDAEGYDSLLITDIPFEEDGRLLDLFDQSGFEDNIDSIFEGEGHLVSMDDAYLDVIEDLEVPKDLDMKLENSVSFSSSPSSPASATSLVSCQL